MRKLEQRRPGLDDTLYWKVLPGVKAFEVGGHVVAIFSGSLVTRFLESFAAHRPDLGLAASVLNVGFMSATWATSPTVPRRPIRCARRGSGSTPGWSGPVFGRGAGAGSARAGGLTWRCCGRPRQVAFLGSAVGADAALVHAAAGLKPRWV